LYVKQYDQIYTLLPVYSIYALVTSRTEAKKLKSLEVTPLKDKKLTVYLIEKEYNEPFWFIEPPSNGSPSKSLRHLFRPSIAFCKFLEKLTERVEPDYVTEELGMRSSKAFHEENVLAQLFARKKTPFFPVDIDENAKGYLVTRMEEKLQVRNQVLEALAKFCQASESMEREYLVAYGQCLQQEVEEMRREANFPIRENWIVMGILDQAREIEDKEEISCIHISSPEHAGEVVKLLESLDVNVETLRLSKKVVSASAKTADSDELADLLQAMQIQAKPVIKNPSDEAPHILFYLDTDKRASSFDICMAYDAGFKAVVPYENVSVEDAKKIVQDAMFSRGPKGIKHTTFFIGGRDAEKAEEILETVKNTMFPPFETGIIIDPCGAYTTAAAAVAKVEEAIAVNKLGSLKDKTCAVFGTGPVGRIIAVLLTRFGCNVMIVSPNPKRKDGEEYVESISKALSSEYGANVEGVFAPTNTEKSKVLRKADVIFCASTEGVRVIGKELLDDLKLLKVMADINAVPPLGIEGIKLGDDMREMAPGIFGIGALTIGKLKYELEKEALKEVRKNGKEVYNFNFALRLAKRLIQRETSIAKLSVTLKYPSKQKE
jgi:methylene-tetrahydromethanopterin dehydrogenase